MTETNEHNTDKPTFVYRESVLSDSDYIQWLSDVKSRYHQSQAKAAVKVNTEMLEFYWSIGRDLVALRAETRWGAGVVKQFAMDMREAFPQSTGFSYTNVKYMKRWYIFYNERVAKGQQPADLFDAEKGHQVGDFLEMPKIFGRVPWKHHVEIICKCQTLDEAVFYVNKVAVEGWSRNKLEAKLPPNSFRRKVLR